MNEKTNEEQVEAKPEGGAGADETLLDDVENFGTASAEWGLELWTTCPKCDNYQEIKINEIDDFWEIFGSPLTSEKCDFNVTCDDEDCSHEFKVTQTEW